MKHVTDLSEASRELWLLAWEAQRVGKLGLDSKEARELFPLGVEVLARLAERIDRIALNQQVGARQMLYGLQPQRRRVRKCPSGVGPGGTTTAA